MTAKVPVDGEWHVLLEGRAADKVRLTDGCAGSGDVQLIELKDKLYLHAPAFDAITDPDEAEAVLRALVREIDGLARLQFGTSYRGTRFDQNLRVQPDGAKHHFVTTEDGIVLGGHADSATVIGGVQAPKPPTPLEQLSATRANRDLAEALSRFSEARDWPELYNVYEAIKVAAGGQALVDAWSGGKAARARFTHSAQQHRHARPSEAPPVKPMSFVEAEAFIESLLRTALHELSHHEVS
jgi:hypothetical protein